MRVGRIAMLAALVLCVGGSAVAQTDWVIDPVEPVLGPGAPGAWDARTRYPLTVILVDGTYHLYFNGQAQGASGLGENDIGHATSVDGVNWETDPANPVLTRGAAGEWDEGALWGASVVHDGAGFHRWYTGGEIDLDVGRGGYATSADGWEWHEQGLAVGRGPEGAYDDRAVFTPEIFVHEGRYYLVYQCVKAPYVVRVKNTVGMAVAKSPDGPWT